MSAPRPGPVLLLGQGGMLWRAWQALLAQHNVEVHSPELDTFDFRDPGSIERTLATRYALVINAAGFTDVDASEMHEPLATEINGTGVGHLARRCAQRGIKLVHYSTDYVFDGQATTPYPVDAPRRPLGAYGRSKALGERLLEAAGGEFLLIRTSWLYAPWGKNFVRTIDHLARQRRLLKVVNDQFGRPTSAEHLAKVCWRLLGHQICGPWHVTDGGSCSWFEFAKAIAAQANPACEVRPCSSAEFARPAPRPAYSVLDLRQTEALIGPFATWRDNLADVLCRLERETHAPVE